MKKLILIILCVMPLLTQAATVITATGAQTWSGPITFTAPAADTNPPTVVSVAVAANGTTVSITLNEPAFAGAGGSGQFVLSMSGGAVDVTYSSGSNPLVLQASRTIYTNETGTINYIQPGNGFQDLAGNDMASFSGGALVNNSTQVVPPPAGNFVELWGASAAWTNSGTGTINQNASWGAIRSGSSLAITNEAGGYTYVATNLYVDDEYFFRFAFVSVTSPSGWEIPLAFSTVNVADYMKISVTESNTLVMSHGELHTVVPGVTIAQNTTNWIWGKWATNGAYNIYWSSTTNKPAGPHLSGTDGIGLTQPQSVVCLTYYGSMIVDEIYIGPTEYQNP